MLKKGKINGLRLLWMDNPLCISYRNDRETVKDGRALNEL